MKSTRHLIVIALVACVVATVAFTSEAKAQAKKPNILVIWGDDLGQDNISAYHRGLMGNRTPNIDRIAKEGALFTDMYAQQSCTAGRASFMLGQNPFRTGLLTIGMPGAKHGVRAQDPGIAELLKPYGYVCGQFGKNHLGDRNEYLPTVHGFDEFYGNLYHLNAEEEPENPDYPKDPAFRAKFGPRGVLDCVATDVHDPTDQPRWGVDFINTKQSSFDITADVESTADKTAGVIVSQAGRFGGWSLYVLDDKPTYVDNFLGMEHYTVTSNTAIPSGKSTVKLDFAIDDKTKLGSGGTATLYINDKKVGSGRVEKTHYGVWSFDETANVGIDRETSVTPDYTEETSEFTGKIDKVTIELKK